MIDHKKNPFKVGDKVKVVRYENYDIREGVVISTSYSAYSKKNKVRIEGVCYSFKGSREHRVRIIVYTVDKVRLLTEEEKNVSNRRHPEDITELHVGMHIETDYPAQAGHAEIIMLYPDEAPNEACILIKYTRNDGSVDESRVYFSEVWIRSGGSAPANLENKKMQTINLWNVTVFDSGNKEKKVATQVIIDTFPVFDADELDCYVQAGIKLGKLAKDKLPPLERIVVKVKRG